MKREYRLFLQDIVGAIKSIQDYVGRSSLDDIKKNRMAADAIVRNIEILGEAVVNIPEDIKKKYPEVPWIKIKNFRNVVIHQYWIVDYDILWDIITTKLQVLKEQIKDILTQEKRSVP